MRVRVGVRVRVRVRVRRRRRYLEMRGTSMGSPSPWVSSKVGVGGRGW